MIDRLAAFSAFFGTVVVVLALWAVVVGAFVAFYRSRRSPLTRAVLVIVPTLILDAALGGEGVWSTLVFLIGFGAQLLLAGVAFAWRRGRLGRRRLGAGVLYAASVLGIVAWTGASNDGTWDRPDEIILACHRGEESQATSTVKLVVRGSGIGRSASRSPGPSPP